MSGGRGWDVLRLAFSFLLQCEVDNNGRTEQPPRTAREKLHINCTGNGIDVDIYPKTLKEFIKEYDKQLWANEFKNLDLIDKFLQK